MGDEQFYLRATEELDANQQEPAIWAKAQTLAKGDPVAARYKYIELRVSQLLMQAEADPDPSLAPPADQSESESDTPDLATEKPAESEPATKGQMNWEGVDTEPAADVDPTADPDEWIARPYKGIGPWLWIMCAQLLLVSLNNLLVSDEHAEAIRVVFNESLLTALKVTAVIKVLMAIAIFFELRRGLVWGTVQTAIAVLWIFYPGIMLVEYFVLAPILVDGWSLERIGGLREISVQLAAACVWPTIWTLYLTKSARIALTFNKEEYLARKRSRRAATE
jgi:hypothetical protein